MAWLVIRLSLVCQIYLRLWGRCRVQSHIYVRNSCRSAHSTTARSQGILKTPETLEGPVQTGPPLMHVPGPLKHDSGLVPAMVQLDIRLPLGKPRLPQGLDSFRGHVAAPGALDVQRRVIPAAADGSINNQASSQHCRTVEVSPCMRLAHRVQQTTIRCTGSCRSRMRDRGWSRPMKPLSHTYPPDSQDALLTPPPTLKAPRPEPLLNRPHTCCPPSSQLVSTLSTPLLRPLHRPLPPVHEHLPQALLHGFAGPGPKSGPRG